MTDAAGTASERPTRTDSRGQSRRGTARGAPRADPEPGARTDAQGRYHAPANFSAAVVGFYLVLVLVLFLASRNSSLIVGSYAPLLLAALILVFLVRYLSTRYRLDADFLLAWRLFGSRRVRLEEVRRIEFTSLRELGPVGFFGSWGWRGRMWSPVVGRFDALQTASEGVLVTAGEIPLFVSPRYPAEFAQELSRRVRSYNEDVELGAGIPGANSRPAGAAARADLQ